jgi:hypothetical protein
MITSICIYLFFLTIQWTKGQFGLYLKEEYQLQIPAVLISAMCIFNIRTCLNTSLVKCSFHCAVVFLAYESCWGSFLCWNYLRLHLLLVPLVVRTIVLNLSRHLI